MILRPEMPPAPYDELVRAFLREPAIPESRKAPVAFLSSALEQLLRDDDHMDVNQRIAANLVSAALHRLDGSYDAWVTGKEK